MYPYKRRLQNYQELVLLCNLQGLYVFSLYGTRTAIIDVLVNFVFVDFCAIIVHHFITYTQVGRMIGKSITSILSSVSHNLKTFYKGKKIEHEEIELSIPDVTYDYQEFQEPMIGL